jgi:2-iminobutanoate/2-iminopropanoate deaminase
MANGARRRAETMAKERIDVEDGKTYGPYSPGVKANGVVWLAGQIAPEAGDDVSSQTTGCLEKIDALLAAANTSKENACFVQVLLDDIADFAAMNEVYSAWLGEMEIPPARAAFEAGALPNAAKVEIVVQAIEQNCC